MHVLVQLTPRVHTTAQTTTIHHPAIPMMIVRKETSALLTPLNASLELYQGTNAPLHTVRLQSEVSSVLYKLATDTDASVDYDGYGRAFLETSRCWRGRVD